MEEFAQTLWEKILNIIEKDMHKESFEIWFRPLKPLSFENGLFIIQMPNKFFSDWIRENWQKRIEQLLTEQTGAMVSIDYQVAQQLEELSTSSVEVGEQPGPETVFESIEFNPKYVFENFVVGPSNRFAFACSEAVAKEPAKAFNPLFLYGGVGLGKTHLLHAIGHYVKKELPQLKVMYVTSEKFINDYIDSLRSEKVPDFRNKYRSLDCLLIDDIQFFVGKQSSQQEFFYTFNTLFDSKKQIVITSDRPPKELPTLEERLISRFEWGVVADIKEPDFETRVAILRKKAEAEKLFVPEDVIVFIATQIKSNIRELEGALIRVVAFASLMGTEITVDKAKEILKDVLSKEETAKPVTIEIIQKSVAKQFNLEISDMRSKKRGSDSIAFPRQIAMYLARTLTEFSTLEIGEAFGGRDHTTVMHACNKVKSKLAGDPYFVGLVNKIIQEIKNSVE